MIDRGIPWLLGEASDFSALGRKFRGDNARLGWSDLIAVLAIIAAIALLFWFLKRTSSGIGRTRNRNSPRQLFKQLCRAHSLTAANGRLLRRLARSQGLAHPARVFVEPHRFDPQRLKPSMRKDESRLNELRGKLFASPPNRYDDETSTG